MASSPLEKDETYIPETKSKVGLVVSGFAVVLACFHIYTSYFGALPAMQHRIFHLTLVLCMIFLIYPSRKGGNIFFKAIDGILLLASIGVGIYVFNTANRFALMALDLDMIDVAVGLTGIFLVLEGTRRCMGWIMPIIASCFLLYTFFGPYMPKVAAHVGFSLERVAYHMFFTMEGVLGSALGISAGLVAIFVIFSAFIARSGAGNFFMDLSFGLFGGFRGGAAKVAVVSSALFGSLSGSSVANVVATGNLTIPIMKKAGYPPHFAGAVEAVSSTGGQITPPMLGAAAFLMVEFLGVPLTRVMEAAILPAALYFFGVFLMVDMQAAKQNLVGLPRNELPNAAKVIKRGGIFFFPIVALVYLLAVENTSPMLACFWAVAITFALGTVHPDGEIKSVKAFVGCLDRGGRGVIQVAAACASAGIIIGSITLTGLGLKLATMLVALADGNLIVLLILTAVVCLILGLGVPTTAAYLIVASLVAPALIKIGVNPLAAHFFVFFYAVVAMITPPVALAAYAAAGIAGSDPNRTGFAAMRLGLTALILPFMLVFGPELIMEGQWQNIVPAVITAVFGVSFLAMALQGWFRGPLYKTQRILLVLAALTLIDPGLLTDLIGASLAAVSYLLGKVLKPNRAKVALEAKSSKNPVS